MITVKDILSWLAENGYAYKNGVLDPQIPLEESQRMIDEFREKENNERPS